MARDRFGNRSVTQAFFGKRHEQRRRSRRDPRIVAPLQDGLLIRAPSDRSLGGNDGDVPGLGGLARRFRAGLDDAYDRHIRDPLADGRQSHGGCSVAGYDETFDVVVGQCSHGLNRVARHGLGALGPIRQAGRVTEIDEVLVGQLRCQRP